MKLLPDDKLASFEEVIGYHFKDRKWLRQALTHSSFSKEVLSQHRGYHVPDYERLEFLGDAALELTTSRMLFDTYDWPEGKLTRERARIVCEPSLAYIAEKYGYGKYILFGHGEEKTGGRERPSILCDVVEAVIGAVLQDGGFEAAKELIEKLIFTEIEHLPDQKVSDFKTRLQEHLQGEGKTAPTYVVISEEGPPHDRIFVVEAMLDGLVLASGKGKSKKKAEQEAAKAALEIVLR